MKVLYISNFKDGTGWSNAALNNMLAMDIAGIDVVPRTITYNGKDCNVPKRFLELEKKSTSGSDVCIQHVLPNSYNYSYNLKNIGYLACETSSFREAMWHKYANMMDEVWVPTNSCKSSCLNTGITKPIKIVPHSINVEEIENLNGKKVEELQSTFNFAFVGEFIERKNLKALIKAFHIEFHPCEPVNLYIKTSGVDISIVNQYCESIKKGLKLRKKYKEEIIISGFLERENYISVLKQCHCFVMPSRGEGFCIPALESMAYGLSVLYTDQTGMNDFCYGLAIKSKREKCFGGVESLPNIYTSNDYWMEIDLDDLCFAMRSEFMKWKDEQVMKQRKIQAIEKAREFSHKNMGENIKEILNDG